MKLREIISLLSSNPLFSRIEDSKLETKSTSSIDDDQSSYRPKNFLSISNQYNEIYYYNPYIKKLYIIKVETTFNEVISIKFQEIKFQLDYDVYKIQLNESARYLAIVGNIGGSILDLNPRVRSTFFSTPIISTTTESKTEEYQSIEGEVYADSLRYKINDFSTLIRQVDWHPLSNTHIVVLYSNNILKIKNIQKEGENEQIFNIDNESSNFRSFCFGPQVNDWTRFTIFLSNDKNELFALCPVVPNNCLIESSFIKRLQSRIIKLKDQSKGNALQVEYYEVLFKWIVSMTTNNTIYEIENQKWIKLSPIPHSTMDHSTRPILQGPLFKASDKERISSIHTITPNNILFSIDQDDTLVPYSIILTFNNLTSDILIICKDSLPLFSNQPLNLINNHNQEFIIKYETLDFRPVDKEISIKPKVSSTNYISFSYPSALVDQMTNSVYFYHGFGVHCAQFNWLSQLYDRINHPSENEEEFESTSLISVIDSWISAQNTQSTPIIGLAILNDVKIGNYLISLPNTTRAIVVDLDGLVSKKSIISDQTQQVSISNSGSMSSLESLTKQPPNIPKTSLPSNLSMRDTLQVVSKYKQSIFNNQSILTECEAIIKSRLKSLERITKDQQNMLSDLKIKIIDIRNKQNQLADAMMVHWKHHQLQSEQLMALTQIENEDKPLSKAELELKKELISIVQKVNIYNEKISYFEKYYKKQQRKGKETNNNTIGKFNIPSEHQIQIQQTLDDQDSEINNNNDQLERLMKQLSV